MRSLVGSSFLAAVGVSVVLGAIACSDSESGPGGAVAGAGAPGLGASAGVAGTASVAGSTGSGGTSFGGAPSAGTAGAPATGGSGGAETGGAAGVGGSMPTAGSVSVGGGGTSAAGAGAGGIANAGAAGMPIGSGKFPFPQNVFSPRCTYPMNRDPADAVKAYERWKREIVVSDGAGGFLRTRRPDSPGAVVNSTVSEGIAYGMILSMVMGDQPTFDALWKYSQLHKNGNGLMNWYIGPNGETLDGGGATDSDEDIAWALVMADRQWGGSGTIGEPYIEAAKRQIEAIWDHEVDHTRDDFLLPGDSWGSNVLFNPSYFAPNQYRIFAEVTGNTGWNRVIDTGYTVLDKCLSAQLGNEENGLAPAWCKPDGSLANDQPKNYQYDSARVPFRIGQDYCYSGEPRAKAYLAKISKFFSDIGAANITDGYDLDGKPHPDPDSKPDGPKSAVFIGSAAVGAMHDPQYSKLAEEGYALVATGELLARSTYYNLSWTALSLLMLSGNLIEYPAQ